MEESHPEVGSLEEAALAIRERVEAGWRDDKGLKESELSLWSFGWVLGSTESLNGTVQEAPFVSLGIEVQTPVLVLLIPSKERWNPVPPSGKAQIPKCWI